MTAAQKLIETTRAAWLTPPSDSEIITAVRQGGITLAEAALSWPHLFGELHD
ncbi:hypothetical protein UFOVP607_35 [uncultured Caudovirales phage]|uniref:Uncharacterized protein n=1 Tax=uncultured Caudovirales phage TaxID=2100421 RepID=A0A6J5N286_9CAUD|nr:hypothetical protein UFOVP607_35 [uncultured Caudovirales phage]